MERHERELEEHADQQHGLADGQKEVLVRADVASRCELERARHDIDQGHPEQHRARTSPGQDEVLSRGFERPAPFLRVGDHRVKRNRQHFDPEQEACEVVGRRG